MSSLCTHTQAIQQGCKHPSVLNSFLTMGDRSLYKVARESHELMRKSLVRPWGCEQV